MWVKLLICTEDTAYVQRLSAFFDRKYADKIETNTFASWGLMQEHISRYPADVILAGEEFAKEAIRYRRECRCAFGLLLNQKYETDAEEITGIAKYQRADRLFQDILDLYSGSGRVKKIDHGRDAKSGKLSVFISPCGGSGTSTIARAYAKKFAAYEKVLYMDMNMLSMPWDSSDDGHGMDAVLMALKSKRDILPLKLISAVSMTADKVYGYGTCSNPLDLYEMKAEDVRRLAEGLKETEEYERIIVDAGAVLSENTLELCLAADAIICIHEASDIGEKKLKKLCSLFELLEQKEESGLFRKTMLFCNKSVMKNMGNHEEQRIHVAGWSPRLAADSYEMVIDRIAQSDAFDNME